MKGYIPEDKVEEIKNRTDIVDVVSQYVTLKKAGRNLLGLCPFHKEKTPSFTVSPDKQIYYCFGCGEGGNAVSFLMNINQMSYPEALRQLASRAGVVIPERTLNREEREQDGIREQIYRINEIASAQFAENLSSSMGSGARAYLARRGFGDEVSRTFRLGFAPDSWRHLRDFLEKGKFPLKTAEQAGLLVPKDTGGSYDRFRGRLIFPIEDISGRVIAFGGRIIGEGEPKYLNSPESPVYTKGRHFYGLYRTREDIRRKGYAILVEGYFDLIALWSAGIRNVIATLGTALTKDQVDLIRRYTPHVAVIFDPDEAGKKALARSLELFLAGNIKAKAVVLPEGYDPDDYVRKFGKEALEKIIKHSGAMVDYYIDHVIGQRRGPEEKRDALRDAVTFIGKIYNASEQDLFIQRVAERLGIEQEQLKKEVRKTGPATSGTKGVQRPEKSTGPIDALEMKLVHIMLEFPGKIPDLHDSNILIYFTTPGELKALGELLHHVYSEEGKIDAFAIISGLQNESLREKFLRLMVDENPYGAGVIDQIIIDTIKQIKRKWYRKKQQALKIELKKAEEQDGDETQRYSLMMKIQELVREEKGL